MFINRHLVSGSLDGKLIIWDTWTGNKVSSFHMLIFLSHHLVIFLKLQRSIINKMTGFFFYLPVLLGSNYTSSVQLGNDSSLFSFWKSCSMRRHGQHVHSLRCQFSGCFRSSQDQEGNDGI